ncbi:hypothetical protein J6590_093579 [Homalodisca vitripennis]|nr:hypothetical protein J6590_093579 [Homalodisca vitripennis]
MLGNHQSDCGPREFSDAEGYTYQTVVHQSSRMQKDRSIKLWSTRVLGCRRIEVPDCGPPEFSDAEGYTYQTVVHQSSRMQKDRSIRVWTTRFAE